MKRLSKLLWVMWPLGCVPFVVLLWQGLSGALGPDPAKTFVAQLGWWAFIGLLLTLSARPLALWLKQPWLVALRRTFGLLSFAYASLHLIAWAWLLLGWDVRYIGDELSKRPYIIVGVSAWLCLLPLAVTSTRNSRRKLGKKWVRLHKLIFPAVLLVLVHDFWIQKSGYTEQVVFALVLFVLLGWRLMEYYKRRKNAQLAAFSAR
ncbi:MAG: sulfoxide reductase heme-binding subunit YedZ [Alcanivoracaceae bacterium]|nr:sulfoxide reductase heme-binding subunit YedZ [Alcanivoracaceae bacterium]